MAVNAAYPRPNNPRLARVFDDALRSGAEVRYADEGSVVVYTQNEWGCGGLIFLVVLGLLTAFIVPLILLLLGALAPGGQVTTYTLRPNGRVKKRQRPARS